MSPGMLRHDISLCFIIIIIIIIKRQWVAVASAGPHASLHLAPDR